MSDDTREIRLREVVRVKSCAECGNQLLIERKTKMEWTKESGFAHTNSRRGTQHIHFCIDCNRDVKVVWKQLEHWSHTPTTLKCMADDNLADEGILRRNSITGKQSISTTWEYDKVESKLLQFILKQEEERLEAFYKEMGI